MIVALLTPSETFDGYIYLGVKKNMIPVSNLDKRPILTFLGICDTTGIS